MTQRDPSYRDAANVEPASPASEPSGGLGCTLLGAALIGSILVAIGYPIARATWLESRRDEADAAFRAFLDDDHADDLHVHAEALECPALSRSVAGHEDVHVRSETQRFGEAPAADARGLVVRVGRRRRVDVAFAALDAGRAAATPDDVDWIAFVTRQRLPDAYSYGAVSVDVEHVEIRIVHRDGAPLATVTLEALPPTQTNTQGHYYTLDPAEVGDAVTAALARRAE